MSHLIVHLKVFLQVSFVVDQNQELAGILPNKEISFFVLMKFIRTEGYQVGDLN